MNFMPLAFAQPGKEVELVGVRAGWGLQRKLADMGLLPGTRVRVMNSGPGPVLIDHMGARLALGHGVALKILVKEV